MPAYIQTIVAITALISIHGYRRHRVFLKPPRSLASVVLLKLLTPPFTAEPSLSTEPGL